MFQPSIKLVTIPARLWRVHFKYVSIIIETSSTGIKRVLEGEIKKAASKAEEGKLIVKYTIPLTPETKYSVLETDYDSYAVLWSCSGIGPFHTQNAWVMTRERLAPGTVLQKVNFTYILFIFSFLFKA